MRTINKHPEWENQPLRLSEEEKQNLYGVFEDFFTCFHLQDMRKILWNWLVAAMSSETCTYNSGFARSNLVFVYEKLELLIEAAHAINKRRKKRLKRKGQRWRRA